jgi:hypothetical protein
MLLETQLRTRKNMMTKAETPAITRPAELIQFLIK